MKSEEVIGKNLPKLRPGRFLCLQVISAADFVLANLDAARWHTSPLVKQGLASDRDLQDLQSHAGKRAYNIAFNFPWALLLSTPLLSHKTF